MLKSAIPLKFFVIVRIKIGLNSFFQMLVKSLDIIILNHVGYSLITLLLSEDIVSVKWSVPSATS